MAVHCSAPATFTQDVGLSWYRSSEWAERGFCTKCGSSLFYRLAADSDALLIVAVDALDDAADFMLERHIYVDAKPGRYEFADEQPRLTGAEFLAEMGAASDSD